MGKQWDVVSSISRLFQRPAGLCNASALLSGASKRCLPRDIAIIGSIQVGHGDKVICEFRGEPTGSDVSLSLQR